MENPQGTAQANAHPSAGPRRIELQRAVVEADETKLRRTAHFTDGTVRALEMQWSEVRRVVSFRRDLEATPVVSVAITDTANVVVLDECMEGWQPMIAMLPQQFPLAPTFVEWQKTAAQDPLASDWTILYAGSK